MGEFKQLTLSKRDHFTPITLLVQGDRGTTGLRLNINRYDGGVDLSKLGWGVKINTAGGSSDVVVLTSQVSEMWVSLDWVLPAIVAADVGDTIIEVDGVGSDGTLVWQSGKRVIKVVEDLDAEPGYEPEDVSQLAQAIETASAKVEALSQSIDDKSTELDEEIADIQSDVDDLGDRVESVEADISGLESSFDSTSQTLASQIASINSSISSINSGISALESDLDDQETHAAAVDASVSALRSSVQTANSEVVALNSEVDTLKSSVISANTAVQTAITNANTATNRANSAASTANTVASAANTAAYAADTAAENARSIYNTVKSAYISGSLKGEPGPQGPQGKQGAPGQDYVLTSADKSEIAGLVDISGKQDTISDLDTIRSGASAGATALQSVPIAGVGTFGLTKPYKDKISYGITMDANGAYINAATTDDITARTNKYKPITPYTINSAVTAALTDSNAMTLTDAEKASACTTIGAATKQDVSGKQDVISDLDTIRSGASAGATALQSVPVSGVKAAIISDELSLTSQEKSKACETIGSYRKPTDGWVLKGTISGNADDRGNIDTGVTVDLAGCTELIISGTTTATGDAAITTNVTWILSDVAKNGTTRNFYARYQDSILGIDSLVGKCVDGNYNIMSTNTSAYVWTNGKHIKDLTRFGFSASSRITSCNIQIYAR